MDEVYSSFEEEVRGFRTGQACKSGCAFCCSHAGSIDVTTLEGLRIRGLIQKFSRSRQKSLEKSLFREVRHREKNLVVPCPFLMKNNVCMIYEIRPFSCRRIYSLHTCTKENPPRVNRKVMDKGEEEIKRLQEIDSTGYLGHISYILHMLDAPGFLDTYMGGGFDPGKIVVFGKSHNIVINQKMTL